MPTDDAAFFREVLELLAESDDGRAPPQPVALTLRPPKGPTGTKEAIQALEEEVAQLSGVLAQLRGARPLVAMEAALHERRKRKRAEQECRELREAVYQQTQFVRGLHAIFDVRPRFSLRLNLCRYLHQHLRLPSERSLRWGDFDTASHENRLHAAKDVLCRETETALSSRESVGFEPFFHCEPVDDVDLRSMTATSVYAIESSDLAAVMRGVCVAVRDLVTLCPFGHSLIVARDIVDADAAAARNILYRVMGIRHRNVASGADVLLESHVITSCKATADYAVVLWDFVDDDQLHPPPHETNITREITGACLIRREWCADGVERTVLRSLCTKRYRYHSLSDAPQRYGYVTQETMEANEKLFQQIIKDQLAAEEALAAQTPKRIRKGASQKEIEIGCGCQLG